MRVWTLFKSSPRQKETVCVCATRVCPCPCALKSCLLGSLCCVAGAGCLTWTWEQPRQAERPWYISHISTPIAYTSTACGRGEALKDRHASQSAATLLLHTAVVRGPGRGLGGGGG